LNRLCGEIVTAELTTEPPASSCGQLAILLEDGQVADPWQYEVLPFPHEDELGVSPIESNGHAT
jgi:hypothetical protein